MGSHDRLLAGDAQFIHAGRGMIHAEQPISGRHGLQLWLSLPPQLKMDEPSYTSIRSAEIPHVIGEGSDLYVIAGDVSGVRGPMALSGGAVFARLQLDAHGDATLEVNSDIELSLYVLQGEIDVGGKNLSEGELGVLGDGSSVTLKARGESSAEAALIGGRPAQGEILLSGPFVMDTPERIEQAKRDFFEGRMGRLDGVPF